MSRGGESDDPAWLKEATTSAAVAVGSNKEVQSAAKNAAKDHVKEKYLGGKKSEGERDVESGQTLDEFEANIDPEELAMMKKMNIALKTSFSIVAVSMTIVAITQILGGPDIEVFFLAGYVLTFAILMCCFEVGLKGISSIIASNFGFLYSLPGRLIFSLFVGFLCFSLKIWGIIVGCAMMLALLLNIYVLCAYPKYEKWLRAKHYKNK